MILVTGSAGFIGSHLVQNLLDKGYFVLGLDDFSLGSQSNIDCLKDLDNRFTFFKCNLSDLTQLRPIFKQFNFDLIINLAANSDIQLGSRDLEVDYQRTFMTTFNLLSLAKEFGIQEFVFASSSAIYGDHGDETLDESRGPLQPTSFYGAAKLASEAYISAHVVQSGLHATTFRFPNVIGSRMTHGVIFDFINKLKENDSFLPILGDGTQTKPYLYVSDLLDGIMCGWTAGKKGLETFNVSGEGATSVTRIAELVVEEMGLADVEFRYSGGKGGWVGDVPTFSYDTSKLQSLGWSSRLVSDDAVRKAIQEQLKWIG